MQIVNLETASVDVPVVSISLLILILSINILDSDNQV